MAKYGTQMAQTLFATATSQPGLVASPPPVSGVSQVRGLHLPQEGLHLHLDWDSGLDSPSAVRIQVSIAQRLSDSMARFRIGLA